jgi:aspartyl-tRNA synthetase
MGRVVTLLADEPGIGGTDAFPLDGNAQDLMTGKDGEKKSPHAATLHRAAATDRA